jgi:hypothetical protein
VHLAWYDPNNTVANLPASPPTHSGHGTRDNDEDVVLTATGSPLPGFTLTFTTLGRSETSDSIQKSYLVVADARYGDNFIVAAHPHGGIAETYEFHENASQEVVLMFQENTGLWKELPDGKDQSGELDPTVPDLQTPILTIFPSVDIDCDSDNTATPTSHGIERSDWEERIENEPDYLGKVVGFNEDDDNENGVPDYLEHAGYDYPNGGTWVPFDDDDLVPVVLDRGFEDLSGMDNAEDPTVFFVFELKMTVDRGLKYWLDRQKTPIVGSLYDPDETQAFTEAGHNKLVYRWLVSAGEVNYPPSICVEGIDPAALTDTLIWRVQRVTVAGGDRTYQLIHEDTVKMTDPGLKVDLDVDSDNNNALGKPDQSLAEETIEEAAPGKVIESWIGNDFDYDLIPDFADGYDFEEGDATSDKEIHGLTEGFVPMVVTLPPGVDPATAKLKFHYSASDPNDVETSIGTIPETGEQIKLYAPAAGHLRIWKKNVGPGRTLADYVEDDKWYTASEVCELYVEGIDPGLTEVTVYLDPNDGVNAPTEDKVKFTVYDLKYVRVYDANKVPNRSTRAVNMPEDRKLYEDNPRSCYDSTTQPGIILGGWGANMDHADLTVEVEYSPAEVGEFLLWKMIANNGCSIAGDAYGSFSSATTVTRQVVPSHAMRREHNKRDDIVVRVGFDSNGNGVLDDGETVVPDFCNQLIGKAEYDYCYRSLTNWTHVLGGTWWPHAGELLEIFTDTNVVHDYDSTRTVSQTYGGTHQLSNALGFDETVDITKGDVVEYIWDSDSSFSSTILSDSDFFDKVIRPAVEGLNIGAYYAERPYVLAHAFSVPISTTVLFEQPDLHFSLKHATIAFHLFVYTERGASKPQITGVEGTGTCVDFYDFRDYGSDDNNGWASRLQVCHTKHYREAGEVFAVYINLNVPKTTFWWDVYYDDLNTLKDKWRGMF